MNYSVVYVGSITICSNSPRELRIEREIYTTRKRSEIKNLEDIVNILKFLTSSNKFYSQKIKIRYNKRKNKIQIEEKINVKSSRNEEARYSDEEHVRISLECKEVEQSCKNIKAILETQYNTERSLKSLDKTVDAALKYMEKKIQTIVSIIENLNYIAEVYKTESNGSYHILVKIIEDIKEILDNYVKTYRKLAQSKAHDGYL